MKLAALPSITGHSTFKSSKPTKIARRWTADGTKVRVSKRTGHIIPKPDFSTFRRPRTKGLKFIYILIFNTLC